jgi:hypothetical protein
MSEDGIRTAPDSRERGRIGGEGCFRRDGKGIFPHPPAIPPVLLPSRPPVGDLTTHTGRQGTGPASQTRGTGRAEEGEQKGRERVPRTIGGTTWIRAVITINHRNYALSSAKGNAIAARLSPFPVAVTRYSALLPPRLLQREVEAMAGHTVLLRCLSHARENGPRFRTVRTRSRAHE